MKYIDISIRRYQVAIPGSQIGPIITEDLQVIRSLRPARLAGLPLAITALPLRVERVPACSWCRARPRVIEYDCDGPYTTVTCDAPQCIEGRHRAYEGIIAYPSHQRGGESPRTIQPIRVRGEAPPSGIVTVDEWGDITCLCGNTPSYAGFHPCLPGGALVEPDHPDWNDLYWCAGVGCPGVIVDYRYIDLEEDSSQDVAKAFPMEIDDECGDCSAPKGAPPEGHHYDCSINWT
ncbi:hypothetical protein ABZ470_26685 [Streptosporangium sp. NPDC020072]|uniref:hypothetical protein n=1 Tax=Streptosporangium sp. NPDC020072 TaxID=3154788 RepID=UPI0034477157